MHPTVLLVRPPHEAATDCAEDNPCGVNPTDKLGLRVSTCKRHSMIGSADVFRLAQSSSFSLLRSLAHCFRSFPSECQL